MAEVSFKSKLITTSVLTGVALATVVLTAVPAAAQNQDATIAQSQDAEAEVESIVVTGSRIARQDYSANSPIVTVTQEDFRATGSVNIESLINDLPQFTALGNAASNSPNLAGQANVQLRGLGATRTLVLLNGRRVVPSNASSVVDLNLLPTPLISSIETITGGASSTYGSDAVGGVLNFLL